MTAVTARELNASYEYVVVENAVREVVRLLPTGPQEELVVSDWYRRVRPGPQGSILELRGPGAETGTGVDAKRYVDELRGAAGERRLLPPRLNEPAERRRQLAAFVAWLESSPLSPGAPRLSREELHERR